MKVRVFQDPKEKKRRGRQCPWSVEWRENGRRRSKTIGKKADAEKYATLKRAELIDGAMGIQTRKRWSDFVAEYLQTEVEGSGKRPGTVELVRIVLNTFTRTAKPTWVHLIDGRTLDRYRRERLKAKGVRGPISPETVKKELRHLRAALNVARRWKYLREVPALPKVTVDQREKPHVSEAHFQAMLDSCDAATLPDPKLHREIDPCDWWKALLVTCWVTGARIEAVLRLRWQDVDWQTGRVLSRASDLKQRKDTRPEISGALPYLRKIRGVDPRLLPWNHHKRTLYSQFYKIQRAAGIDLPCLRADDPGHECGEACGLYGFHSFRYAHARFNHDNPELQEQMGHATAATTDHYRRWGARQMATYGAYLPKGLGGGKLGTKQRENSGDNSGKRAFRVVGA